VSLRRYIKRAGGALCGSPLLSPLIVSQSRKSVNVVYYHFVGESAPHYDAFYAGCTLKRFVTDLEQLSRVFAFAPLVEVIADGPDQNGSKKPKLAVTFDDGLDFTQTGVMEVLSRFGVSATNFVITSCVDNQHLMWRHKLSAIKSMVAESTCVAEFNQLAQRRRLSPIQSASQLMDATSRWDMNAKDSLASELWEHCQLPPVSKYLATRKPYISWDGLRSWQKEGHSVGFHTHSHPYCARLQPADVQAELIEPALNLKKKLDLAELCLSYPFGSRLPRPLEDQVFSKDVFKAIFGIKGFRKRGASHQRLERAGVEQDGVAWPVFAHSFLKNFVSDRD
jgi:peptidoglycan/xylan/chitin deacetylase (PgdA/CDA1 family)